MKIPFNYYAPKPTASKKKPTFKVNVRRKVKIFAAAFGKPTKTECPEIPIASFLAASLRAGYGTYLDAKTKLNGVDHQTLADLRAYIRSRVRLLRDAIITADKAPLSYRGFWKYVESSEKGVLSFLIGMTAAELTIGRWLKHHQNTSLMALYHYRLYMHPTTGTLAITTTQKNPRSKRVPDFLAHDSAGNWHVVEAKGISKSSIWPEAKKGLGQASQITSVTALAGGGGGLKSHNVSIASASKSGLITLSLVDPAPRDKTKHFELCINKSALDISAAASLLSLWEAYEDEEISDFVAGGFSFKRKYLPDLDVWIGVPEWLLRIKATIYEAVEFGEWINRYLRRLIGIKKSASTSQYKEPAARFDLLVKNVRKKFPALLARLLENRETLAPVIETQSLGSVLARIYEKLFGDLYSQIRAHAESMALARKAQRQIDLEADFFSQIAFDAQRRSVVFSPDGLLVIAGESWLASPEMAENNKGDV